MFSNVQNVNSVAKPLETEATDARLRKEHSNDVVDPEQDNQGRQHFEQQDNEANAFSINALIYFLEDFLEARLSSKLSVATNSQDVSSIAPWMKAEHSNVNEKPRIQPKSAANAYAHGADTIQQDNTPEKTKHDYPENVNDAYHLLRDLRDLRDAGVTELRLDNRVTFFEGVHNAVYLAKLELS